MAGRPKQTTILVVVTVFFPPLPGRPASSQQPNNQPFPPLKSLTVVYLFWDDFVSRLDKSLHLLPALIAGRRRDSGGLLVISNAAVITGRGRRKEEGET